MEQILKCLTVGLMLSTAPMAWAQTETAPPTENGATEAEAVLTQAELENLVAPIALYPDTLLIQVLVAATFPLQVVKADEFVNANAGLETEAMQAAVDGQEYDESVAVLAVAFPDVLADMADNVGWTETIGTAMLADSDAVLAAVQTMRTQAINSGALVSGSAQTVSVEEENVIIQPTDPQVVYVPQYDTQTVYVDNGSNVGDAVGAALITFGAFVIIDEIFDNNNNWHGYWGCRNCGGWGGRPIIRNPDIDIDINGNVNIGNRVGNGSGNRGDIGWKPEPRRQQEARKKISSKRGPDGATKMPVRKQASRGDDLRSSLSNKSGARDISRPGADRTNIERPKNDRPRVNRPSTRPGTSKKAAIDRTNRKPAAAKPAVRKPRAKPAKHTPAARAPAKRKPSAMKQRAAPKRSRAASNRGRASGGARSRGRR